MRQIDETACGSRKSTIVQHEKTCALSGRFAVLATKVCRRSDERFSPSNSFLYKALKEFLALCVVSHHRRALPERFAAPIGKEKRLVIKAVHMPTEIPQIIETNFGRPASVLKDHLKLVLRHLKGPMRQRVPNVLGKGVISLL